MYKTMSKNSDHLEMAYDMARYFSKPAAHFHELVEFLLAETPENMTKFLTPKLHIDRTTAGLFTPVIESEKNRAK